MILNLLDEIGVASQASNASSDHFGEWPLVLAGSFSRHRELNSTYRKREPEGRRSSKVCAPSDRRFGISPTGDDCPGDSLSGPCIFVRAARCARHPPGCDDG